MKKLRIAFLLVLLLAPVPALAIPPPDFIFNMFSQIGQILAISLVVISSVFGFCFQYLRGWWSSIKFKKSFVLLTVAVALSAGYGISYFLESQKAAAEFDAWQKQEVLKRQQQAEKTETELRKKVIELEERLQEAELGLTEAQQKLEDKEGELEGAQMKLALTQVPDSVRAGRAKKGKILVPASGGKVKYSAFFKKNIAVSAMISNAELKEKLAAGDKEIVIIDAREDIEFDAGHYQGAKHLRYADLRAGQWKELPTDKYVIIFCYTSLRGSDVAEFLRSVGIAARFVEEGVKGWIKFGGSWQGSPLLPDKYRQPRHLKRLSLFEFKQMLKSEIVVIDTRPPEVFEKSHVDGAINISILRHTKSELEEKYKLVPQGKTVVPVCDEHWSCFDAYVVGVELERRGHKYVGRFDKLSQYKP